MRPRRAVLLLAGLLFGACDGTAPTPQAQPATTTTTSTTSATTTTTPPVARVRPLRASRGVTAPRVARGVDEATRQRVIAAIYAYSDWDAARMVRIASCESGLNPWAVNGKHHGIFQIANSTLGLVEEHVALAHSMWLKRGLQPWQCKG